jgi:hypothetical protein
MMKQLFALILLLLATTGFAQNEFGNAAENLQPISNDKVVFGGYAQIDYNQPFKSGYLQNGKLDVHRMILFFGYNFSEKTQFVSEIEVEHVVEIYVEQAWLNHEISPWLNFRGGLLLIPMGIINEYHEPPTYNGVERPNVDNVIVPSTWREMGFGFIGFFQDAGINYQAYLVNGFNGYNGLAKFKGSNGLRSGRQKGAESYISSPNIAIKADWNSIPGLNIGVAGYFGNTQSTLYHGVSKTDKAAITKADSTVVGLAMLGVDGRYNVGNFQLRGQYIYVSLSNAAAYNQFTGSDLGSAMLGWYTEAAYSFYFGNDAPKKLTPFVRFEKYDTHLTVSGSTVRNAAYNRTDVTLGASLELSRGAVLKADYQWFGNAAETAYKQQLNLGIGIWF